MFCIIAEAIIIIKKSRSAVSPDISGDIIESHLLGIDHLYPYSFIGNKKKIGHVEIIMAHSLRYGSKAAEIVAGQFILRKKFPRLFSPLFKRPLHQITDIFFIAGAAVPDLLQ